MKNPLMSRRIGKDSQVNIRIDAKLLHEVRLIALMNKTTVTDIITRAMVEYVSKDPANTLQE